MTAEAYPPDRRASRLYTLSWRAALDWQPEGVTLVRISLGKPKWGNRSGLDVAALPYISELAPTGGLFHLDGEEFDRAFYDRLDAIGVDRIERRFQELLDEHDGQPLVLLCFERLPQECHRGTFARWWEERTGEQVPELPPPPIGGGTAPAPEREPMQGSLL